MKVFENKKIFNKIVIVLLVLTVFSFCFSGKVQAKDDDGFGGKLLSPIVDLLVFSGDSIMNIIHKVIYKYSETTISVDMINSVGETILTLFVGVAIAAIVAAAIVFGGAAIIALVAKAGITLASVGVGTVLLLSTTAGVAAASVFNSRALPDTVYLPIYQVTPEKIFSNEVLLFDVDFFNPSKDAYVRDKKGDILEDENTGDPVILQSTAKSLRTTISNWYRILRDIALVALLSVLVYIGIRIVISSTSNDKAKYKGMLLDWIVAICLLFVMQYIMSFSNLLVEKVIELITTTKPEQGYTTLIEDEKGKIEETLKELGYDTSDLKVEQEDAEGKKHTYINWETDLLGVARVNAQMAKKQNSTYAGYAIIFVVLVLFTVYFIFTYLKRVLYMAFLTIIAPLVAMTYPIDKINDGKAQAFNMWFKEYIFNLLIQPMHLLLYTILVTSSFELAADNIIYSLVALGFMIPAEKLLRKFFGFEKAQTPGLLAGPAGAALMMQGLKAIGKPPKGAGKSSSGNASKSATSDDSDGKPPRINPNFDKDEELFGGKDDSNVKATLPSGEVNNSGDDRLSSPYSDDSLNGMNNYLTNSNQRNNSTTNEDNDSRNNNLDDSRENTNIYMPRGNDFINREDNNLNRNQINMNKDNVSSKNNIEKQNKRKLKKGHPVRAFGSSLGAASRYYTRGAANHIKRAAKNRIENAHPIKTATRFAAGAAGAAALGTAGLAVGITSGDATKAAQYTAAAALGGYKMGSGVARNTDRFDSLTPENVSEIAERARYDSEDEYKEAKQEKYVKDYQKNEKYMFELESSYGKKEAKRIMDKDVPELLNNGITDIKDIMTIEDLVKDEKNNVKNIKQGISVKKYASRIGEDSTKMTEKKRKEWHETFSKEFGKKEKYKDYNHNEMADSVLNQVDAFNKIKYSK